MKKFDQKIKTVISKVFSEVVKEVDKAFPTTADCFDEIFRLLADGLCCTRCGGTTFVHGHGARTAKCVKCKRKKHFTAGSPIFDHIRKPKASLTALIASKNGVIFNSHMLHLECKVAYQSAYTIFEKISGQANEIMESASTAVLSNEFDKAICKRSLETDAQKHPSTEKEKELAAMMEPDRDLVQSRIREFFGTNVSDESQEKAPFYADEQKIFDLLADGPLSPSQLAEISGIPLSKVTGSVMILLSCELVIQQPGGKYKRAPIAITTFSDKATLDRIAHAVKLLRIVFHGVSRRYIQRYLAAYWCFLGRSQAEREKLFLHCCKPLVDAKTSAANYVSPIVLSFPSVFYQEENAYGF